MREFIDKDRPVSLEYYDVLDMLNEGKELDIIDSLRNLIKKDPYYMDTYLLLAELLIANDLEEDAQEYIDTAYQKSLELILDKKGNWPDKIEWGWIENRHVFRAIFTKATDYWKKKQVVEAKALFDKMLRINPNDNAGARYSLLAILEGMTYAQFEKRFNRGGYFDNEIFNWFDKTVKSHPEELGWWMDIEFE